MRIVVGFCLAVGLFGTAALAEITPEQVAGKTLTYKKSTFLIGADGSLTGQTDSGEQVVGTWQVKDGLWCRTISQPARLAGRSCQVATIKGRNLTLVRDDGTAVTWKMK